MLHSESRQERQWEDIGGLIWADASDMKVNVDRAGLDCPPRDLHPVWPYAEDTRISRFSGGCSSFELSAQYIIRPVVYKA